MLRSEARKQRTLATCGMRRGGPAAPGDGPALRSGAVLTGHGAEIFVNPPQQLDQDFPFVLVEAGQQPAFAIERGDDDLVVGSASPRGQRNRMAAAVVRRGPDRNQAAFLHRREGAAHRALVEPDDVADPRGLDAGLDRQERHDPPLRDVDAKISLVEYGRAVRQFVGDEGDERRNVAIEIEQRAFIGGSGLRRTWPARLSGKGILAHGSIIAAESRASNRDMGQGFTRTNFGRCR
jgi:hypothetical protein